MLAVTIHSSDALEMSRAVLKKSDELQIQAQPYKGR